MAKGERQEVAIVIIRDKKRPAELVKCQIVRAEVKRPTKPITYQIVYEEQEKRSVKPVKCQIVYTREKGEG